jgi:hypothetical protein
LNVEAIQKAMLLLEIYDYWGPKTVQYAEDIEAGVDVLKGIYEHGY